MTAEKRVDHLRLVHREAADAPPLPDDELGKELEPLVYEGEVLPPANEERQATAALQVRSVGPIVHVQPSETTIKVAATLLVGGVTVASGWHSWWVRAWNGLFFGTYRKQIRIADETCDREALAYWQDRKQQAVEKRRQHMLELPKLALSMLKVGCGAVALLIVLVPLVALLVWMTGGDGTAVFEWVGGFLRWVFAAVALLWVPFLVALPVAFVVGGWREGRRKGAVAPRWLATGEPAAGEGRDEIPDESAILKALQHLELAPLNKAFKAGWRPRFVLPTQRDGNGYHTQVELPPAATVEMIVDKKKVLAHNLVRFPVEVWATEPRDKPGVLDLWVADQGSLSGPVDPWPLLHEGAGDYFKGVPCAVDIRRKSIVGRTFEANYAVAGTMGSGKSTLIITLLLGALLDPLVDADVFVMADNADYKPMKPRLRTLMTSASDEVAEACLATLSDLYADLTARGQALKEHNARAVTRPLAEIDARLRPRIVVIDECQALFMHETLGRKALETCVKLQNACRKYAITLIYATPEPSTDSLPRRLIAVTSNRACFAINDQRSNDAVLGTGSYKAGISAVGLDPKTDENDGDVGTFMGRGFTPKPGLLRGYYVSQSQAGPVVERALKNREKASIGSATPGLRARDLLDDLDEVLGSERARLADLPAMLRRLAPSWLPYQSLTGNQLRDVLVQEHGVRVTNTGNVLRLDPQDLRTVRAQRQAGE